MLPFQVTLIPLFVVYSRLGWVNSFLPLIVPHWFGSALYIFLLRQFFMTIPMELSEAAHRQRGRLRIYWQVILPLAKAASLPSPSLSSSPVGAITLARSSAPEATRNYTLFRSASA